MTRSTYLISALVGLLCLMPGAHAGADCYVGVGAGKSLTAVIPDNVGGPATINLNGFQIGARAGCDVAVPLSPLVLGGFVGYDWLDIDSDTDAAYASIGARAGYKINDGTLAYGLVGLAAPDFQFQDSDARGVMYGAGLEIDFSNVSPGLVGFVEWNRIDWRDTGADASTDTIMVGARIKLNVLK